MTPQLLQRGAAPRTPPGVRTLATASHFGAIFATGVSTGVAFGHVLEKAPKKELPPPVYLGVQRNLYRRYGAAGAVLEPLGLAASVVLAVLGRTRRERTLGAAAAALTLAETGVWKFFLDPINRRILTWTTPESLPPDWSRLRDRWERLHTLRAGIAAAALGALILAAMRTSDRPR
jgi:hypothetical protein